MKRKAVDRYVFALVLVATAFFSLSPARADQAQPQLGTVVFHLAGRATSMNSTSSLGLASLDLTGGGLGDGQGGLMIQNLSGTLQIGFANYSIFTGDGKSDMLGNLMMLGESSSGELVLQGIIKHNSTVTTDATLSRLASLAYLALSGSMLLTEMPSGSATSGELTQNAVGTVGNFTNVNSSVNSTTATQSASSLSSVGNFTVQTSSENISLSESSATSLGQITPTLVMPEQNITMASTQFGNHTITVYVSSTVANITITETTTTTIADTTTTVVSSVTGSNTTVTVTNSTTSGT